MKKNRLMLFIGFRGDSFLPDVFRGIKWGAGKAYGKTMEKLGMSGFKTHVLQSLMDIDDIDDLREFYEKNRGKKSSSSLTMFCLTALSGQSHIQKHHNGTAEHRPHCCKIGIAASLRLGYHLLDHHEYHRACGKAQGIGKKRS